MGVICIIDWSKFKTEVHLKFSKDANEILKLIDECEIQEELDE